MSGQRDDEERLAAVDSAARALPRELKPGRDLWPGILARIEPVAGAETRRTAPPWRRLGALAAVFALVGLSSAITWWVTRSAQPVVVRQVAVPAPADGMSVRASFGPGYVLGPKYERARAALVRDLDSQLEQLPPETREVVARNLAQIRQAVDQINVELAADPDNMLLQELLMAAYQDEVGVLMNVNRMVRNLPTRAEI